MQFPEGEQDRDTISSHISIRDFQEGFKAVSKKISPSLCGRHLRHYKAILQDEIISLVYATFMSVPYEFGFTLECWQNALQIMLEKVKGTPRIDK